MEEYFEGDELVLVEVFVPVLGLIEIVCADLDFGEIFYELVDDLEVVVDTFCGFNEESIGFEVEAAVGVDY